MNALSDKILAEEEEKDGENDGNDYYDEGTNEVSYPDYYDGSDRLPEDYYFQEGMEEEYDEMNPREIKAWRLDSIRQ